jgi:predicted nucleic acid-binding protein
MSATLVDSSAWIDFFRGDRAAVRRIDALLAEDRVGVTGVIAAEVLSGAPDRASFQRLRTALHSLGWVDEPEDAWERVADTRFALARAGHQAAITDVLIAVTAAHSGHLLLTRDRDFQRIAPLLSLDLEVF